LSSTAAPGSVVGGAPPRPRLPDFWKRSGWQAALFIAPAVILLVGLVVYPVLWTIRLSFDTGRGLEPRRWVGFDNYVTLFTEDRRFLNLNEFPPEGALVNNVLWLVLYTALCLALGLLIAVLATRVRYEALIKAIIFVPMAISAVAVGLIWKFVYSPDPDLGVLNALRTGVFGLDALPFLGREDLVNYSIIVAYVWASAGFAMVVLSAALKGISQEIIEAARTDGASEWAIFRRIQLPLLALPISVVTVWLMINVIKLFDIIYIMTAGGPNGKSQVIAYMMYDQTFQGGKGGYGSAIAVVMLLLIIPIMAFNIKRFRSQAIQG
jgi:alpha-glucoside transport system permease protein